MTDFQKVIEQVGKFEPIAGQTSQQMNLLAQRRMEII